jgi:hypothetical protein
MVRHGGCLGLGLAAMGTAREGNVHMLTYLCGNECSQIGSQKTRFML